MTRINSNIAPETLHRLHLIAELREITMVPAALHRSLRTRTPTQILSSIPKTFSLNKGHVTFFYDKQLFLFKRFHALANEMISRGYSPNLSRSNAFLSLPIEFQNDWESSIQDDTLVHQRIALRISQKPHLYT